MPSSKKLSAKLLQCAEEDDSLESGSKLGRAVLNYTTYYVNGDTYTGAWKGKLKDGKGTYKWKKSGNVYDGDWLDNYRDGFGTLSVRTPGGTHRKQYAGGWKFGKKHGFGTNFYSETKSYEGEWLCGKRHGWGRMVFEDCSVYEGEWDNDEMCGSGIMLLANGHRYEGGFKDSKKSGEGTFYYTDKGQKFDGVWVDDVPKCGQMSDYSRDVVADPTPYPIPVLELSNAEEVLQEARQLLQERLKK